MMRPFLVWDSTHDFGDVVIAEFSDESDAKLFVQAKSSRKGGFHYGLLVGTSIETRRQIPVD